MIEFKLKSLERDSAYLNKFDRVAIPAAFFIDKAINLILKEFLFMGGMTVFSLSS